MASTYWGVYTVTRMVRARVAVAPMLLVEAVGATVVIAPIIVLVAGPTVSPADSEHWSKVCLM